MAELEESKEKLRTGFTTGTCATASSIASVLAIINQKKIDSVEVVLPNGNNITIKIHNCEFNETKAQCSVIRWRR